ncbi:MAG: nucleoside hydrolase, partial [Chloroflexota bacterium]
AEANIWHDPEAAQVVFDAGWPVTAVGLDVTDSTMIPGSLIDELRDSGTIAGVHLHKITQNYLDIYGSRRGRRECAMHDALTLGIAADPTLVLESRKVRVDVELTGTHTRGMTVGDFRAWADQSNANVTVVLDVDRQRFVNRWTEVIKGR